MSVKSFKTLKTKIGSYLKNLLTKKYGFPFLYVFMAELLPSTLDLSKYIILNTSEMTIFLLSLNDLFVGIVTSSFFLLMIPYLKTKDPYILMQIGIIVRVFRVLFMIYLCYCGIFNFYLLFFLRFCEESFNLISDGFINFPLIGKISEIIPKGFESFGVSLAFNLNHLPFVFSTNFDALQIRYFNIKDGYYSRIQSLLIFNLVIGCLAILPGPLLLRYGYRKR